MTLRTLLPLIAAGLAVLPLARAHAAGEPARVGAPLVHGNMAVYFVHGASATGPVPQTLQEALAKGTVEVRETGNVSELEVENTGDTPVFIQLGDIVKGGQQDRVLTVSMVLPAKSGRVPIGSYCVEQGRWTKRGLEDARRFAASDALMPSREAKIAIAKPEGLGVPAPTAGVTAALDTDGARQQRTATARPRAGGQSEVWESVARVQRQLSAALSAPVASETSKTSLQLALENEKLKEAQAAFVAALEPAGLKDADVVGVVVAVNGRVSSADLYPSNGLFRKMWPKLARAAATEALAAKSAESPSAPAPAADAVKAFLDEAEAATPETRSVGTLAKLETREAKQAVSVSATTPKGELVHRNYVAK